MRRTWVAGVGAGLVVAALAVTGGATSYGVGDRPDGGEHLDADRPGQVEQPVDLPQRVEPRPRPDAPSGTGTQRPERPERPERPSAVPARRPAPAPLLEYGDTG